MTNRERFFNLLEKKPLDRLPFFPDISTWYECTRKEMGEEEIFGPGAYIPDAEGFHRRPSRLPGRMGRMTFLDFYREYDWGLPVHMAAWVKISYDDKVTEEITREGPFKITTLTTPRGTLRARHQLAADGSWAPIEHFVKELKDLEAIKYALAHQHFTPAFHEIEKFHRETEGFGVCDLVLWRSPFGQLVHDLMGFEQVIYALYDHENVVLEMLEFMTEHKLKLVELAAQAPARLAIISDHADENLIAPPFYRKYCIPYYQKATSILHRAGKLISTHLDGNFRSFFPFIKETGFDLLDGCTPAPMFNYTPEELAVAAGEDLHCYCGVPATLLTQRLPTREIVNFGLRIAKAFRNRVLVNIGDILPPEGDIEQVIELGKAVQSLRG
ncbi:MAG: uroporphyrinogen decarboxylase family protein [Bacteroidota bacterium]